MKKITLLIASIITTTLIYAQGWTPKASFAGTGRYGAVAFSIGSKGYLGTGTSFTQDFWEYDPATDVWTQKTDFAGVVREGAVGFSIGSKGYIGAGYHGAYLYDFWEYDAVGNAWTAKSNFPGTGIYYGVGFSMGTKGYAVTGGTDSVMWEWDQATDIWSPKANFPGATREQSTGFSIGTKGYVGTGYSPALGMVVNDFWEYDQTTDMWTPKASFAGIPRDGASSFAIGTKGYLGLGNPNSTDFWEYDPSLDTWTSKPTFPGSQLWNDIGFSIGNQGFIATGYTSGNELWQFDAVCSPTIAAPADISTCNDMTPALGTPVTGGGGCGVLTVSNDAPVSFPIGTTTVTWTVDDGAGHTAIDSQMVTVNPLPPVAANATSNNVCAGTLVTLFGSGASSYAWDNGIVDGISFVPAVGTVTYNVTGTDTNGCINTSFTMITVDAPPDYGTVSLNMSSICVGDPSLTFSTVGFTGNVDWFFYDTVTTSYNYFGSGDGFMPGAPGTTEVGQWLFAAIASNGSCPNDTSAFLSLMVNALPVVTASSDTTLCEGGSLILTGGGALTYSWDNGVTDAVSFVPPAGSITYNVIGTDANGCSNSASTNVTVNSLPFVLANPSFTSLCAGSPLTLSGLGAVTYTWDNGVTDTVSFVPPVGTTTYNVTGTDANGCVNTASVTITVHPLPTVTYNDTIDFACSYLGPFSLDNYSPAGGIFLGPFVASGMFDPSSAGAGTWLISYYYTDGDGCTGSATDSILVSVCSGVNQTTNENTISIYPNPFIDFITFTSDRDNMENIKIMNVLGETVYYSQLSNMQSTFDIHQLPAGAYFAEVKTGRGMVNKKLIKN